MWLWMALSKVHSPHFRPGHFNAPLCDTVGNGSSGSSGSTAQYCFTCLLICCSLFRVQVFFLRSFSLSRYLKCTTVFRSVRSKRYNYSGTDLRTAKNRLGTRLQTCRVREDLLCVCAWCVCVFMCMCMHDILCMCVCVHVCVYTRMCVCRICHVIAKWIWAPPPSIYTQWTSCNSGRWRNREKLKMSKRLARLSLTW